MTVELFNVSPIHFCHHEPEFNRFYLINSPKKLSALKENPKMLSFGQIKEVIRVILISQNFYKYVSEKLQVKCSI